LNDSSVRILVAEWIPTLNKGELAILIGMLKTFEVLGNVEVSVFSFYPSLDKERYPSNVKIIDVGSNLYVGASLPEKSGLVRTRANLLAIFQHLFFIMLYKVLGENVLRIMNKPIWKEYCESNVIIICHDQISCVEGSFLRFSPIYTTLLANVLHKPIVIYANGTNLALKSQGKKLVPRPGEVLTRYVLDNVDLVTVRDEESYSYLKDISHRKAHIHLTADPAILLPSVDPQRVRSIMLEENIDRNNGLLIGAAITREVILNAFQEHANPATKYMMAIREIATLMDYLIENFQANVVFIPHCIEQYQLRDDRMIAKEIYNLMTNKHKVRILVREYSSEELKGLTGEFDLYIGARIHSVISALSMGVPSCTLTSPWDRRAYCLIGKMLKQEKWIYNVENLKAERLFARVTDLLSASNEIRKDLPFITNSVKEKALDNGRLLKALLDSQLTSPGVTDFTKNRC